MTSSVFAADVVDLPRGPAALPREQVAASQRQRLVHGVTVAVADKGFAAVTVADIAARAGVSKKTFYEHFEDKSACFVAAYDHGSAAILRASADAANAARRSGADAVAQLRAGTGGYLAFLAFEATYARTFALEVLAAGPAAVARHRACRDAFARSLAGWHALARRTHRDWPAASPFAYEAATGLVYEVCGARIAQDRLEELAGLLDDLVDAQLRVLGAPVPGADESGRSAP